MSLNLNNVKSKLEKLTCPVHLKHPEIRIIGSELKFNCCCEQLKSKCVTESGKAFAKEGERVITDVLNKAFKKFG